jgi:hypothetical protein
VEPDKFDELLADVTALGESFVAFVNKWGQFEKSPPDLTPEQDVRFREATAAVDRALKV